MEGADFVDVERNIITGLVPMIRFVRSHAGDAAAEKYYSHRKQARRYLLHTQARSLPQPPAGHSYDERIVREEKEEKREFTEGSSMETRFNERGRVIEVR